MPDVGVHIIVKGVVQGVGFRYWTQRTAKNLDLVGYTQNLPDETVEIKAEGSRGIIEEFIKEVKVGPTYAHVTDLVINWYRQLHGFTDFSIKY
ncbi:MAG: acylphosphatase [Candidatus Zixiibacteriota bacterium]